MKRILLASLTLIAASMGACQWLLPERFAINGPILHQLFGVGGGEALSPEAVDQAFRVPQGLGLTLYAAELPGVRLLRFGPGGHLLASLTRAGEIRRIEPDRDRDGRSDGVHVVLANLDRPHGLDFHDGWLYVAEAGAIGRVRFDPVSGNAVGAFERIVTGLPDDGNHYTKTLRFGPDDGMYVSVGSSCNVCEETDPRRATILRYRPDGTGEELFATGLRNAVGFDWQPGTNRLYATDNGRDLLGDDFPPCELNAIEAGGFYGFPYANGDRIADPDFGAGHPDPIAASISPAHEFRAHNAPLGMTFVRGHALRNFEGAALVALHGSWNRTVPDGYRVVSLHWQPDGAIIERDFMSGFLTNGNVIGRPVAVIEGPEGAIFISDDYAGVIYRVAPGAAPAARTRARPGSAGAPLAAVSEDERRAGARRGAVLAEAHACASCHARERAAPGVTVVPLENLASRYDLASLEAFLAAPTPPMPRFPLTQQERRDLALHLLRDGR